MNWRILFMSILTSKHILIDLFAAYTNIDIFGLKEFYSLRCGMKGHFLKQEAFSIIKAVQLLLNSLQFGRTH